MVAETPTCQKCCKPALVEPIRRLDLTVFLCMRCTGGFLDAEWSWLVDAYRNRNGVLTHDKAKRKSPPQAGPYVHFH